jgi:hypothetical protein
LRHEDLERLSRKERYEGLTSSCSWRIVGVIAAGGWIALDALLGRPDEHGR